jgi:hypothetical protein
VTDLIPPGAGASEVEIAEYIASLESLSTDAVASEGVEL